VKSVVNKPVNLILVIDEIEARHPITVRPITAYEIDDVESPTTRAVSG
jgi:hypothetical protein